MVAGEGNEIPEHSMLLIATEAIGEVHLGIWLVFFQTEQVTNGGIMPLITRKPTSSLVGFSNGTAPKHKNLAERIRVFGYSTPCTRS